MKGVIGGAPLRRSVLVALVGSAAVVVASFAAIYSLPWIQFPPGARSLPGLSASVSINLDRHGVPRIEARTREDAFAALGYMTGRDRLFQIDLMRRKTAGRLAEVLGESLIEDDRLNRTFGFSGLAGEILARLPDSQQSVLASYAAGINQAMDDMLALPFEFWALNYKPERWSPKDSILVALNLASLSYAVEEERMASVMREALPMAVVSFLTPDSDCYNEQLAPSGADFCAETSRPPEELGALLRRSTRKAANSGVIRKTSDARGSNAWAVGGRKSRDGRAMIANDMHLALGLPNTWYQAD